MNVVNKNQNAFARNGAEPRICARARRDEPVAFALVTRVWLGWVEFLRYRQRTHERGRGNTAKRNKRNQAKDKGGKQTQATHEDRHNVQAVACLRYSRPATQNQTSSRAGNCGTRFRMQSAMSGNTAWTLLRKSSCMSMRRLSMLYSDHARSIGLRSERMNLDLGRVCR